VDEESEIKLLESLSIRRDTSSGPDTEAYVVRGGIRIGDSYWLSGNYTVPLVELRITATDLRFLYPLRNAVVLPRETVTEIHTRWAVLGPGIRFIHRAPGALPFVLFWTYNRKEILGVLREMGYPVTDANVVNFLCFSRRW
jgi:hypothetical protein